MLRCPMVRSHYTVRNMAVEYRQIQECPLLAYFCALDRDIFAFLKDCFRRALPFTLGRPKFCSDNVCYLDLPQSARKLPFS
jgi:hypothetical protein